jgi:hypothetical protein
MAGHGVVEKVEVLGTNETVKWSQNKKALEIVPLHNYPSSDAVCYKIAVKQSNDK